MVRFRQLYMLADTAIVRHKRLPLAYQPYDAEQEFKWEALRVQRMLHKLRYRRQIHSLFRRQQGICALCGHAISKDTGWHDHHVVRRVDGIRPAKSSTQPCKAKTWCALKFKWAPVLAF